jgi:hypothetical protein
MSAAIHEAFFTGRKRPPFRLRPGQAWKTPKCSCEIIEIDDDRDSVLVRQSRVVTVRQRSVREWICKMRARLEPRQ